MSLKRKRKELIGLVGAIGVAVALAGFVGGWISVRSTIVWCFAIWTVGTMLVTVLTDGPDKGDGK